MLNIDYLSILKTQSVTGDTADMMNEIQLQLSRIQGLTIETDSYGNLYVTKGKSDTYPAFVSHTDTVHKIKENYLVHYDPAGFWYATSSDNGELNQVGIGGDDKVGIILCLELLHRLKKVKVAFFKDEESGCKGSKAGLLSFFDNCRYAIQIDRKGSGDIITRGSGTELCSNDFENLLDEIGKKYEYKHTTGASTDVVALKDRGLGISAVNLSCGYYNPHHGDEYINEAEMMNCLEFCVAISRIKTVYPHEKKVYKYEAPAKRDYSGIPWTGSGYTSKATGFCKDCKRPLSLRESVICRDCLRKAVDGMILAIDRKSGERYLMFNDFPLLPPEYDDKLPAAECLMCRKPNFHSIEKDRGYCNTCLNCPICDNMLISTADLLNGQHEVCPDSNFCKTSGCVSFLMNDVEKMEKTCNTCKSQLL